MFDSSSQSRFCDIYLSTGNSQSSGDSRGSPSIRRADNQHQAVRQWDTSAGDIELQNPPVAFGQFFFAFRIEWLDGFGSRHWGFEIFDVPQLDAAFPVKRKA